jgi:hypothetical protein
MKHRRAERGVTECAYLWVEYGKTVRNLSLAESILARNEQARMREPLADAELPGLKYEPSNRAAYSAEMRLAFEANKGVALGEFAVA